MQPPSALCSVVLTVHNRRETVERALRSVLAQSYRPLEVVVVDNGSTDGSRERCAAILDEVKGESERSFQLLVQPRKGACAARNMGLQAARGKWVAFFDDDDEMSPDFVETMMKAAETCQTPRQWVLTRTRMILPDGREKVRAGSPSATLVDHILGSFVSTQSILVRREWLISLGGWDENLPVWNDYALGVLLFCHDHTPLYIAGPFHRIYQHPDSLTATPIAQKAEGIILALQATSRILAKRALLSPSASRSACLALYRRLEITAGHLLRDGHSAWATHLLVSTSSLVPSSRFQRLFGRLLRRYTALGGRAAWRWARWGLSHS